MNKASKRSKIFLDSGDPKETKLILSELGYLDGQTTNPTLVAKNPTVVKYLKSGKKYNEAEIYEMYKHIVTEISLLIPDGSVSIEVYANKTTSPEKMFDQASEFNSWIPNAHIKYPITPSGLQAAHDSVQANMKVNMTLCFSQQQAAAVYGATKGAHSGDVFISPFIGRLDDIGKNGLSLIQNILDMYSQGDGHVEVLAASVRTIEHLLECLAIGADIITAPYSVLHEWVAIGAPTKNIDRVTVPYLKTIPSEKLNLSEPWKKYNVQHELTDIGIEKFTHDWEALIQ